MLLIVRRGSTSHADGLSMGPEIGFGDLGTTEAFHAVILFLDH